jgi:hypothetical protein
VQKSGHRLSADFDLYYALKGTFVANDQLVREGDTLVVTCGEMPELLANPEAEVVLVTIWDDASD